jgi:hypothetical protein
VPGTQQADSPDHKRPRRFVFPKLRGKIDRKSTIGAMAGDPSVMQFKVQSDMANHKNMFLEIIKNPVGELVTDAAELAIDEIFDRVVKDADVLKNIPILKWFFLGQSIFSNIHLSFFIKKYALFIGPIKKEISNDFWENEKFNDLTINRKKFNKIIDETIVALDRYQAINKAKILGVLFVKTFKERIFTIDEYNTLLFSIELMHPYLGLECLKQFYLYRLRMDKKLEKETKRKTWLEGSKLDFSPLASTCLIQLPKGGANTGDLGGAYINDLGFKFYEEVVMNIESA